MVMNGLFTCYDLSFFVFGEFTPRSLTWMDAMQLWTNLNHSCMEIID